MLATDVLVPPVPFATPAAPLPAELGSVLLTLATSAVPIRLVSRLSRDLSLTLAGRTVADADLVLLAALLARAAGPWLPTPQRFAAIARQIEAVLGRAGCTREDVGAVLGDLDEAFAARRAWRRGQRRRRERTRSPRERGRAVKAAYSKSAGAART